MIPGYLEELKRRARQAFPDDKIGRALDRYRAIVGPTPTEGSDAEAALEALRSGEIPTAKQIAALEKLIRMMRPAVFVRQGWADGLHSDVQPTFPAWDAFRQFLKPLAYSIGAIFRKETISERLTLIGTGFVVAPRILMTNRHVIEMLTHGSGILDSDTAFVDFEQEADLLPSTTALPVRSIIAIHDQHDLALLEIDDPAGRQPLSFGAVADDEEGVDVAVVGYPVSDVIRNPLFVSALFGGRFGVKRAAPGDIVGSTKHALWHDCTTLGGNSGSPVFRISSGEVVGVHREGLFLTRNEAVPGPIAREFVEHPK